MIERLQQIYFFKRVPRADLEALLHDLPTSTWEQGEVVYREGDVARTALLLVEGRLQATVGDGDQPVGDVRPGEIAGETALFRQGGRRNATLTAIGPATALVLRPEILTRSPGNLALVALEVQLLGTLARRIRSTNNAIQRAWRETGEAPPGQRSRATLRQQLRRFLRR